MHYDLKKIISLINSFHDKTTGKVTIPDAYFYPSAIAVITAYLYANKISESNLLLPLKHKGYFDAIGLGACLFHNDQYQNHRVKCGVNYSPMVHIQSADAVDTATSTINSCITSLTKDSHNKSIKELKHVIGELHDNVWSHGLESGFSMAQRSKVPHTQEDYLIEFALADNGLGFLEETKRAKISSINTHQEAIDWCIRKGNTTKPPKTDSWTQSIPEGCIGSPYPATITVATNTGSHHQGLGLAKLIDLVNTYHGELDVASGDTILHVRNNKNFYELLPSSWKGVAISCRLRVSELCNGTTTPEIPSEISSIMKLLRGE